MMDKLKNANNDLRARDKEMLIRQSEIMELKAGKAELQAMYAHTLFSSVAILISSV